MTKSWREKQHISIFSFLFQIAFFPFQIRPRNTGLAVQASLYSPTICQANKRNFHLLHIHWKAQKSFLSFMQNPNEIQKHPLTLPDYLVPSSYQFLFHIHSKSVIIHRLRKREDWTRNFRSFILRPILAQFTTMTVVHFPGT
jgi:hypothetical protein